MIRQRLPRLVLLLPFVAAVLLSGCVSVQTTGGRVTYWVVPGMESSAVSNRAGTTYFNQRWATSPDTHPAVAGTPAPQPGATAPPVAAIAPQAGTPASEPAAREAPESGSGSRSPAYPPYSTRTSGEVRSDGQLAGGIVGSLIGAQAGNRPGGIVVGAALGTLAGGKLADPCQPDANAGSIWGALAGGLLGSMFGGGRSRDFFIALGAGGGALRGTEMWGDGRRCR